MALGRPTAPWLAGTLDVAAPNARMQSDTARARGRAEAERFHAEIRQKLVDAIYAGQPFRQALRDLGLTSNQVWGLTKTMTSGRQ